MCNDHLPAPLKWARPVALATGILPIALGGATKTVPYVMDGRKAYRFTIRWGEARDTDDAEGAVVARSDLRPDKPAILADLSQV